MTRKASMEAVNASVVKPIKDDSSLDEKTDADRKFAALLSPRALATTSPKLDRAKRITVRTNVQAVDLFHQEAATPLPQRSHKTMIQRRAGTGAPGTGLARRPLNFLAPPLPVAETTHSDAGTPAVSEASSPATDEDVGVRPQTTALKDLPDPVPSPKAKETGTQESSEEDSDLPSLEHPTPVASPAPAPASASVAPAESEEELQEELPDDGEAILEELSDLLNPCPALPPTPHSALSDKATELLMRAENEPSSALDADDDA